jgi:hypothetical protein
MEGRGKVNILATDIGREVREVKVEPLPHPKKEERPAPPERRERQVPQRRRKREKVTV